MKLKEHLKHDKTSFHSISEDNERFKGEIL